MKGKVPLSALLHSQYHLQKSGSIQHISWISLKDTKILLKHKTVSEGRMKESLNMFLDNRFEDVNPLNLEVKFWVV